MWTSVSLNEERFKLGYIKCFAYPEYLWLDAGNRTRRMGTYCLMSEILWNNKGSQGLIKDLSCKPRITLSISLMLTASLDSQASAITYLHPPNAHTTFCYSSICPHQLITLSQSVTFFPMQSTFYLAPHADTSNSLKMPFSWAWSLLFDAYWIFFWVCQESISFSKSPVLVAQFRYLASQSQTSVNCCLLIWMHGVWELTHPERDT